MKENVTKESPQGFHSGLIPGPQRKGAETGDQLQVLPELKRLGRSREEHVRTGTAPNCVAVRMHLQQIISPTAAVPLLLLLLKGSLLLEFGAQSLELRARPIELVLGIEVKPRV